MRSLLSLFVPLLVVSGGLAGCLGEDEPAAAAPAAADAVDVKNAAADNSTRANDGNATVDDGSSQMSQDLGHQPHMHDYWKGKERVTLMNEEVEVDAFDAFVFTFFDVIMGTPGVGGAYVQLPDGAIVYEGTGKLQFTATWSEPTIHGLGVRYRNPASTQWSEPQPLTSGQPFELDVKPEMTDMPHSKTSRWEFLLVPAQAGGIVFGKVNVQVDILKMRDISQFPGHPELFNGANTLVLYNGPATSTTNNFAMRAVNFMTGSDSESGVASAKVVPMETRTMTANLTIQSSTSNVGEVSNITFLYKSADSNWYRRAQYVSGDFASGQFQFAWPVEMQQTDSPYAKESQWRFDLRIGTDPAGQGWETSGLTDSKVEYELEVVAYDSLLPGVEELEDYRDRDDDDDR